MERNEPPHSENLICEASSSSTSLHVGDYEGQTRMLKGNNYEVFLSFRGKDTRKGFTDCLYTSLVEAGICVFKDDNELSVGEEIGPELLCNITQSKISIPIISENYASSKWCLRELAQMLKCKRSRGQIVLPIFYKVGPSQARHLTGTFGDAINAHKENFDETVTNEWAEALKEVSSLSVWESEKIDNGHEGALIKKVVREVLSQLKRLFRLDVPRQLVGIDDLVEQIMTSIDGYFNGTRIIGIYGMGGVGKTILAKALYNELSSQFEYRSFVANVRETSQRKGFECLQKQLISDIIRSSCDVSNVDEGIGILKSRFTHKEVLILLDDVDASAQLNALAGDGNWFKAGSIVIITTRNKSILDEARVNYMYQHNELSLDQSLILFSRHAFRKDSPQSNYEDISHDIVSTTGGLPLALEVIGSFLCGKSQEVWVDTLKKLMKVPNKKVQEKLRISFDALEYEEQQIFLDIACFFVGSSKQSLTHMWDAYGYFPQKGIEVLCLMSLIKVDDYGKLMMHDQLRDLGREIVRLENPKNPQTRSRLWIHEEAVDVLDNNKGTDKIEALRLDRNGWGRSYTGEQFKELTGLRFLQMQGVNLSGDFQNLLPELRSLWWEGCPLRVTPTNFHPKKLVELDLSRNVISENWGGWDLLKKANKLKVLNLSHCVSLRTSPDVSALESLEILNLEDCWNLKEIHPSIEDIKTLISLNVRRCGRLQELPRGIGRMEELRELILDYTAIQEIPISRGLMKLKTLSASWCRQLVQLPESVGSLVALNQLTLSHTGIEELPHSIGFLEELKFLDLSYCASLADIPSSIGNLKSLYALEVTHCKKLRQLPESIGCLESLEHLMLSHCSTLRVLPHSIGKLESLIELNLSSTEIIQLPDNIGELQHLRILDISETRITKLPGAIGKLAKLQELRASGCINLELLPSSTGELISLKKLDLDKSGISSLPESIGGLQNLRILDISETRITELPGAIGKLAKLQELRASGCINLEVLPSSIGELISLKKLDLDKSGISSLPESISKLSSLRSLSVRHCEKLRELPELPSGLTSLGITCQSPPLPHLSRQTFLKKLTLSDNCWLDCLPELPFGLSMLSVLRCGKLKALTNLSNLKHLSELILDKHLFELILNSSKVRRSISPKKPKS